ncbi:MAG TPA: YcaO-like family protein [Longimicrobiaceae bacterium]|nr:YcaO-like family protein [Longimicrobiaceae bacterium]
MIADLATAEISIGAPEPHPESRPPRWTSAAGRSAAPSPLRLQDRWTDASLRAAGEVRLDGLVSPEVGPIRGELSTLDGTSLPTTTTKIAWNHGKETQFCYGKSFRPAEASFVARCEALERIHVIYPPPEEPLVYGSYNELRDCAVDPRSLFFPEVRANPIAEPMYWAWATDPLDGASVLVPAQEIWFNTSNLPGEHDFFRSTTNACALGGTVEDAALFALFEAVERDSYLTMWYLRRPCARIDPDTVDHEPFQLLRRRWGAAFADYDLHLFDITTDVAIPAVAGIAVRRSGDGLRTFHSAAARLSVERACFAALKDLTGFTPHLSSERRKEFRRLLHYPERVSTPEDHYGLYALDETFERLSFLDFRGDAPRIHAREIGERALVPAQDRYNLGAVLERVAEHLRSLGAAAYLKDITHPSLAARGLSCVKVITPGLYPLWFGANQQRFAVTDRLRRLARDFGSHELRDERDCNLEVHPFS